MSFAKDKIFAVHEKRWIKFYITFSSELTVKGKLKRIMVDRILKSFGIDDEKYKDEFLRHAKVEDFNKSSAEIWIKDSDQELIKKFIPKK
ncbi:hypothetical protein [Apilactobacillus xinyiensis]|uniref:hypothetical protein n=1 Tax=Apilactobacillus xinyiensis TaxID=2841032 RepID=UPI00200DB2E7|nr:hypothetical protein [Apilactobacillus xinyiensis]MCL0330597.1 hypothetical protein [Apilactobacillus xinyiensis]